MTQTTTYGPQCTEACTDHGSYCQLDAGHAGEHLCHIGEGADARMRHRILADRVQGHKTTRELTVAPDED